MKRIKKRISGCLMIWFVMFLATPAVSVAQEKFAESLDKSTASIKQNLEWNPAYVNTQGSSRLEGTSLFIYDIVSKFVFPLLIASSILVVILGLYEIMFSGKEEVEKGTKYIIYGVVGIVIIQSAKFITSTYISIVSKVVPYDNTAQSINFARSAYEIYNQLIMPFINVFTYVIIGTLFVILLVHVMRFITSSEEDVAAKAKSIMLSNIVGIIVILLAKTMVEAIYGKQADVIKTNGPTNLGDVGSGILAGADFTLVFSIINYILGFLGLIILILIIVQTYQLLVNPTNEDLIKKVRSNLLYILIGLGIIGLAYVIVNFIIIR